MEFLPELQEFLKENNFDLLESKFDGRVEIYFSNYFILRIVEDRNLFKSTEISSKIDPNNWFNLNIIRSFILKNEDYLRALDFEVGYNFFMKYYDEIADLFSSKNYFRTAKSLKKLEDRRAEIKYGHL